MTVLDVPVITPSPAAALKSLSLEDFLALADSTNYELIDGVLTESKGQPVIVLSGDDTLVGQGVLEGFSCPIQRFFAKTPSPSQAAATVTPAAPPAQS